ncbi:iron-siderophore ABC transporter substrate-binding protein [Agrobacterium sp.]|uniref:iron-siderophore ABC transporter substrate-binding protein n=1 Tax=Agrobacterium sp. TaxID=361 RepID=UPI0028AA9B7F|nr:iron-siderophore ABC transporter substrate-binding protein [Agrobacterium sp.]
MVIEIQRRSFIAGVAALAATPDLLVAAPAKRVVTLEWTSTEIALSLGISPVGCAEPSGYRTWVNIENNKLDGAVDVGRRQQPSLEAIRKLEPDLILSSRFRHASLASALGDIAPTHLIDDQDGDADMLAAVYRSVGQAGTALSLKNEADVLLGQFDRAVEMLKAKSSQKIAGRKLLVAQPLPGVPRLRVFAPNAAISMLLNKIGFTAALDMSPQPFGFTTIDLEGLATLDGDSALFMLAEQLPQELADAALWPILPVVAQGNVHLAANPRWPFGSTASLQKLLEDIVGTFA